MLRSFNVLDRQQEIGIHTLLEASAGTGKTFAIENIVARFLIEKQLKLETLLIVTFTRAATRDLKERVRKHLQNLKNFLSQFIENKSITNECPDYLLAVIEQGEKAARDALCCLETALFIYDQAQIFTIHGFCWRMLDSYALEGGLNLASQYSEDSSSLNTSLLLAIRDFLRTELHADQYSSEQLKILLRRVRRDLNHLEQSLLYEVSRGIEILPSPGFKEHLELFQSTMHQLKQQCDYRSQNIIEDFFAQVPRYNKLTNKQKQINPDILTKVNSFAELFDKVTWGAQDFNRLIADGIILLEVFNPKNRTKRSETAPSKPLHYPMLLEVLRVNLMPIVDKARSSSMLFNRLACDCQRFLKRYKYHEETFGHQDLLIQMQEAIQNLKFLQKIRKTYQVAIIDEFQDTDPIQWEIFSALFAQFDWKGALYLVGDPKQSIYSFRQADIYTYLSAANHLGQDALYSLNTNFRSQPKLVEALNVIFSSAKDLFPLPKELKSLPFTAVNAGHSIEKESTDNSACVQFWIVREKETEKTIEEHFFFPAIVKELIRLKQDDNIPFSKCAILIADRYQGARLCTYLKSCSIPVKLQRSADLAKSPALVMMREVIQGIFNYSNLGELSIALSGKLIGLSHEKLLMLEEENHLIPILITCETLRQAMQLSIGQFFNEFMSSVWHADGRNVLERLLSEEGGDDFYCSWQDIAELLIQEQINKSLSINQLILFLNEFDQLSQNDDPRVKAYVDTSEDGVSLLTTHISKGLEFDIVFTLGMIHRPKASIDKLIPILQDGKQYLGAINDLNDPNYTNFCAESDAEKLRQLYVAMTRAKYRLYIPAIILGEDNKIQPGCASPMDLFLARLNQPPTDYLGWYDRLKCQDGTAFMQFIEQQEKAISISWRLLEKDERPIHFNHDQESQDLIQPPIVHVTSPAARLHSFTSITHQKKMFQPIQHMPHDFDAKVKTPHTLPVGANTGIILHRILENVPFHLVKEKHDPSCLIPWVRPVIENTPYESWELAILEMILKVIKTPLTGTSFCLADVDPHKIYREHEFLYTSEITLCPGFLKGVIDLIFEQNGLYYLVDWKSNWLGETAIDYSPESMNNAIVINQYDIQGEIYIENLRRYLQLFCKKPFEEIFGGMFYVFLRGGTLKLHSHAPSEDD